MLRGLRGYRLQNLFLKRAHDLFVFWQLAWLYEPISPPYLFCFF